MTAAHFNAALTSDQTDMTLRHVLPQANAPGFVRVCFYQQVCLALARSSPSAVLP
jgi:hypothetical protein